MTKLDRCYIVGSGVRKTAREKDFIYHVHDNLLKIWNSAKDEKPDTFKKFFEDAADDHVFCTGGQRSKLYLVFSDSNIV